MAEVAAHHNRSLQERSIEAGLEIAARFSSWGRFTGNFGNIVVVARQPRPGLSFLRKVNRIFADSRMIPALANVPTPKSWF
jgi:hypothetical protein